MAYSFTQIEKDKTQAITMVLSFLTGLYVVSFGVIATIIANQNFFQQLLSGRPAQLQLLSPLYYFVIICVAVIVAVLQWLWTARGLVDNTSRLMGARNLDPDDERQKGFANIVEEVSVATGGMKIRPMVIPSLSLNAFAIADGEAVPVIGVTQGLLYKLTRPQLEAVVGHEAAHVVSGDCENTTVVSSMFGIFEALAVGIQTVFRGMVLTDTDDKRPSSRYRLGGYGGGGGREDAAPYALKSGGAFVILMLVAVFILTVNFLAKCMRMLISRQREYRADATAVRLTRDPLSLAQALYIIGHRRHQLSGKGDSFESFFIVNPKNSALSEGEGMVSDLFSTHPPLSKRIKILLAMARARPENLEDALAISREKEQEISAEIKKHEARERIKMGEVWLLLKGDEWLGPFSMETVIRLDWVTPDTGIQHVEGGLVTSLAGMPQFQHVRQRLGKSLSEQEKICPACSGELEEVFYELVKVRRCRQCQGILCDENTVGVLLNRREKTFDGRIQAMAQTLEEERRSITNEQLYYRRSDRFYRCRDCRNRQRPLLKRLFNRIYPVEIDKCPQCGLTWFDKDELEVLQCMFERQDDRSRQSGNTRETVRE